MLRFGILGTGSIAAEVAEAIRLSSLCDAVAVASRSGERAERFAATHGIEASFGSYEEMLAEAEVDVVYVATPHPQHRRWAGAAIGAGRHVLCEKPLTVNAAEAEEIVAAAEEAGLLLLEAYAYAFHPQTELLTKLVAEGVIGELRSVSVTFSYDLAEGRMIDHALGGGGILDVGCYCTSMIGRLLAAAGAPGPVPVPVEVLGMADLDPVERTDRYAFALLRHEGGVIATAACGVGLEQDNRVQVFGSDGWLELPVPAWLDGHRNVTTQVILHRTGGEEEIFEQPGGPHLFTREVDGMAHLLERPRAVWEEHSQATIANMRTLDAWRAAAGVEYDFERGPTGTGPTVRRMPDGEPTS